MANRRFGRCLRDGARSVMSADAALRAGLLLVALVACPGVAFAQSVIRRGGEFVVNSYTYGIQRRVDVASNAGGQFVVVWQTWYNTPSVNQFDVLGELLDSGRP